MKIRENHTQLISLNLSKVEIRDYNFMIDGRNFFDQPIDSMAKTCENIRNIALGRGDDYPTGYFLDYTYFKDHYKMVAVDLSKQQALDADPRTIQQINFTEKFRQSRKYKNLFHS